MEESNRIVLEPFVYQVSGHHHMFQYDEMTVCKPLSSREYYFYKTMPECLTSFIPICRGLVEVGIEENSDGSYTLAGYPIQETYSPYTSQDSSLKNENDAINSKIIVSDNFEQEAIEQNDTSIKAGDQNPWSLRCHQKSIVRYRNSENKGKRKFILLENVVAHFTHPCILDLKMGTRQHGDDDDEEKIELKKKRCEETTSLSLGIRLHGMQVYDSDSNEFSCKNKYFGRDLRNDNFIDALYMFLESGKSKTIRYDVIDPIIERLEELERVILRVETFRFYSSSLLIMYEGLQHSEQCDEIKTDVAHSNISGTSPTDSDISSKNSHKSINCLAQSKVSIKMIDFAHTTHEGYKKDSVRHTGPDAGYLIGVRSLLRLFKHIKADNS